MSDGDKSNLALKCVISLKVGCWLGSCSYAWHVESSHMES